MAEIVEFETEVEQGDFKVDKEAEAKAREQFELFQARWRNGHSEYIDQAEKQERFYRGDQWDEKILKQLEAEGRPALTLNLVLSTINTFLGEQITRRVDLQYKPQKEASKEEGHALSAVAMSVLDANQFDWKETEMVEDGAIRDRGYLNFRVSFDENHQGEIECVNLHPDSVVLDSKITSYDPKDWPGVTITTWETLDEIESRFGEDKRDELEKAVAFSGTFGTESARFDGLDDPKQLDDPWDLPFLSKESQRQLHQVRVIDRQYYRNTRIFMIIDPETGEQRELPPGTNSKKAQILADRLGVQLRAKTSRRLYWRVTCDRIVLWEGWSPYDTPTVIPYFPYFRKGQPFGIVRNLISPQEQYNKVSSQELHIVNSTANGGWVVKRGGLLNMTTDDLRENGSQTGVVLEVKDLNSVDKIQPNQIPTGITNIKKDTQMAVRNIAGMSDTFVGGDGGEVSGVAMKSKVNRGQVQIQKPLDNLARTRYLVGRKMLELMQRFYTDTRIMTVIDYTLPGMPTREVTINEPQEDGSILNDFARGVYSTNIATMPARDAYEDSQFAEVLNLMSVGVPIPAYHAVRYSHLTHREAIADELKQMAGLEAPTEQEQELAQIQQQLTLQDMQISIEEKAARVKELASKANLNNAKTQNELTEADRELRRLMFELQKERESYNTRLRLSNMQGTQKLDAIDMSARADLLKQTIGANNAPAT